jgi:exosortase/archaeosortase family protein
MAGAAGISVNLLHWSGVPAIQRGLLIQLPTGIVGLEEACSGIRSLHTALMLGLFLGELFRLPTLRRLTLVLAGATTAFLLNTARAFALASIAARGDPRAVEAWHDPAGWLVVALTLIALWILAARGRSGSPGPGAPSAPAPAAPPALGNAHARSGAWRLPAGLLLWQVACWAATQTWYASHERGLTPPPRLTLRWPSRAPGFTAKPVPDRVRRLLRFNEGHGFSWSGPGTEQWQAFAFSWDPGRASRQLARRHSPELCLPAAGWRLVAPPSTHRFEIGGGSLPARLYAFDDGSQRQFVLFALWEGQATGSDALTLDRLGRLREVAAGRRHAGAQWLELAVSGPETLAQATGVFARFMLDAARLALPEYSAKPQTEPPSTNR